MKEINLVERGPFMNPFMKIILKILSSPTLDVAEDYRWMRWLRRVVSGGPKKGYRMMDLQLFSEDYSHEIPIRIFYPKHQQHPEPILFFHGGGWVIGDIDTYTNPCINLADSTGRVVYSVDYRLAPEHPYPAGFDDCYRAADFLFNQTNLKQLNGAESAPDWILVGDSAGANLAAAVSLRLKELKKERPKKQVLFYPVTYWDHTEESPFESIQTNGYDYGLTSAKVQSYMEMYAPDMNVRKTALVSPLMEKDLSHLPDTLLLTAEFDPLRDEGAAFGKSLRDAGNYARIHQVEGAVHGFFTYPMSSPTLSGAFKIMNEFLNEEKEEEKIE